MLSKVSVCCIYKQKVSEQLLCTTKRNSWAELISEQQNWEQNLKNFLSVHIKTNATYFMTLRTELFLFNTVEDSWSYSPNSAVWFIVNLPYHEEVCTQYAISTVVIWEGSFYPDGWKKPACPDDNWFYYSGRCIKVYSTTATHADGMSHCRKLGGDLYRPTYNDYISVRGLLGVHPVRVV